MQALQKLVIGSVILGLIASIYTCNFRRIKDHAPSGVHGLYSLNKERVFVTNISKDSVILLLATSGITINSGRLNEYDPPWDSLRYVFGNIICQGQNIKAYVEFSLKSIQPTTFKLIWIKSEPNINESEYNRITARYYECFEQILKENNII